MCALNLQRLVLDSFSEALAAHTAWREPSRETGVFVGVSQLEYARLTLEAGAGLNTYYATGAHLSVASGELSKQGSSRCPVFATLSLARTLAGDAVVRSCRRESAAT